MWLISSWDQDPCTRVQQSLRRSNRWYPTAEVTSPVWTFEPSRPICFDNIFDRPPAYRTAGINLSFQLEPAVVAQAHMSAGVDNCVDLLVKANGAFSVFSCRGQFWGSESRRGGRTERRAGSSHWRKKQENICGYFKKEQTWVHADRYL